MGSSTICASRCRTLAVLGCLPKSASQQVRIISVAIMVLIMTSDRNNRNNCDTCTSCNFFNHGNKNEYRNIEEIMSTQRQHV